MSRTRQAKFNLRSDERLDDLVRDGLKIIQKPGSFCFTIDAVLLANFATIKRGDEVVDLGTGSGVIPLLLTTRQKARHIKGIDIQETVIERASRSVEGNGLAELISMELGDIKNISAQLGLGKYDLVTSNPPYLPSGRGKINPNNEVALSRHELCCNLEDVIRESARLLNSNGRFSMVHRPGRLADIIFLMRSNGLEPKRLRMVYPAWDKKPNMVLIEAVKGAMADLDIVPPLFVYDDEGNYTKELMDIYYPGR